MLQWSTVRTFTDANGRILTYSYTNRNALYQVSETVGTATYAYDAEGNETGLTNPNGTTVANVYDAANRLTSLTNKRGTGITLSSFGYGYNTDDKRTSVTEASGDVVSYGYDGLLHLSSESRTGTNGYTAVYVVDGVGNRTSSTVGGVTTTYAYDNDDELTATSGGFTNSYAYNANGDQTTRTLSGTSYSLTYDYDDQLISTGGAGFAYDAAGRRASRTAGGVTTSFLFDGGSVLLEKQGGSTTATYTYGNALIRKDGETPLFDGLGSERTVTNASQAVTASLTLSAFGQTVASSGSSSSAYQFGATSGYRTEGDAGLTLVGCRFYDAQVGRFVTRDTYLNQAPYAYCNGDPVNALDPSGHLSAGTIGAAGGGLIFGVIGGILGGPPGAMIGGGLGSALGGWIGGHYFDHESNDDLWQDGLWNFGWGLIGGLPIVKVVRPIYVIKIFKIVHWN